MITLNFMSIHSKFHKKESELIFLLAHGIFLWLKRTLVQIYTLFFSENGLCGDYAFLALEKYCISCTSHEICSISRAYRSKPSEKYRSGVVREGSFFITHVFFGVLQCDLGPLKHTLELKKLCII